MAKQIVKAPVAKAPVANTPVAPTHPVGVGHSTPGGHIAAWRAQGPFALTASLQLVSAVNPWRPGTPGHAFWATVLNAKPAPATVGAALALAAKGGVKAGLAQAHLRWLYTWGGAYLKVGGKLYAAPGAPAPAPARGPGFIWPRLLAG